MIRLLSVATQMYKYTQKYSVAIKVYFYYVYYFK